MKSFKFLPPAAIFAALAIAPVARANSTKSITVTNNTTYTMTELYASSTYHSNDWTSSPNLLTGQSIGPGQTANVTVADGTSYCHYDFMGILFGAAQASYTYTLNTCDSGSNTWTVSASN